MATKEKPVRPKQKASLFQIREFPPELRWKIRAKAFSLQMTVREYAIGVFEAALKGGVR